MRGPNDQMTWHQQLRIEAEQPTQSLEGVPTDAVAARDAIPNEKGEAHGETSSIHSTDTQTAAETTAKAPEKSSDSAIGEPMNTTPKKQIKVTKTGKLLSSPPKPLFGPASTPKKRRGRPPKTKILPTVTVIKYGLDMDISSRIAFGQRIEDILNGPKRSTKRSTTSKKAPLKPIGPPKATHPFFVGKASQAKAAPPAKPPSEQRPPTPRKSAVTPGKLRAEARRDRSPGPMPSFGTSSASSRVSKQAGLIEATWPSKESVHVRNLEDNNKLGHMKHSTTAHVKLKPRKLKRNIIRLSDDEAVIARLSNDVTLNIQRREPLQKSDFEPPTDVRLPARLLTTGADIQRRVLRQMQARSLGQAEQRETSLTGHPAVTTLFSEIEHSLTPFDEGKYETQAWSQKYSPKCASHVLQHGSEAMTLKNWLHSLTVLAVGGALKASAPLDVKKPPRKKRKKAVDDFIVSDDEEEEEDMLELSSVEILPVPQPPSMVRPQWTRNKNVILISGPHGCGKSAMVHAVAKELGFEVFEIHSGMRRSGKDIQDKVGDMTANHLVNHKRSAAPAQEEITTADNTDNERMDTALQDDLTSGRQGTMTSFFQTKPVMKPKPIAKPKKEEARSQESNRTLATQAVLPLVAAAQRSQKQSLILFEEADILFEEDQQFWAQVTKLALNSKRPIVITCNDERQIPLLDLPLAAILRLHPPPVTLATDYLLALAGKEGHVLERQAVSDLYELKNHDLRASIAELDFWCQMSVGDRKGGLEWIYQRWPPGKDVDTEGRLLRVASEGTYRTGMGWLSHNVFETESNVAFDKEEELLQEIWTDWSIGPDDWVMRDEPTSGLRGPVPPNNLRALEDLDAFTESCSAADVYCRIGLPSYEHDHDEPVDSTLPPITDKARLSYTLAAPLLQVNHRADYLNLDRSLSTQTHLLIKRAYPLLSHQSAPPTTGQPSTECEYARGIVTTLQNKRTTDDSISRLDFAAALDVLAAPPDYTQPERTFYNLTPSSFDRTFRIITLDLAPYVRSIVAHEQVLEAQRLRISNLLSAGGSAKRARTTRASRVALEGGVRETKRRDRWFDSALNFELVMRTAGKNWAGLGWKGEEVDEDEAMGSLTETLDGTQDTDVSMNGSQEN